MRNPFFAHAKKVLRWSAPGAYSAAVGKSVGTEILTEVRHLTDEECLTIAGGPQVQNVPEEGQITFSNFRISQN
ncbi:hypothetical protein LPN04_12130 [Rugamonas sp. A1-17]|nr:hypothetical protein [Rugamonas sp. A1-17]